LIGRRRIWADWTVIGAILIIGAVSASAIFKITRDLDTARVQAILEKRAEWRADDLEHKIRLAAAPIEALAGYIAVQENLNITDLHNFSAALLKSDAVRPMLHWAPLVKADERNDFIEQAKRSSSPTYDLKQRAPDGTFITANERDQYLPVLFEEQAGSQPSILGFDELSESVRRLHIERARDEAQPIATPPIDINIGDKTALGYLVFWPVYRYGLTPTSVEARRADLRGIVIGRFLFDDALNAAIAKTPSIIEAIDILIDRGRDGGPPRLVGHYSLETQRFSAASALTTPETDVFTITRDFDFLARHWTMQFHFPAAAYDERRSSGPWAWLLLGLGLTAAAVSYVRHQKTRFSAVEALVQGRTDELSSTNAVLNREIQERKQSSTQFKATFDQAAVGIAHVALDGTILLVNDRYCEIVGRKRDQLIGLTSAEISHQDDAYLQSPIIAQLISGEIPRHSRDKRYITADGAVVWGRLTASLVRSDAGEPLYLMAVVEDISSAKAAEEALRASEARLRAAVQGPGVGLAEQDLDLRYTYLEADFGRYTVQGTTMNSDFFVGKTDDELYGEGHPAIAEKRAVIETGIGLHREIPFAVDQTELLYEVWINPRRDESGEINGLRASYIDITERRNTEMQLRQAQKMEAIGNLTGGLAHDFNNLLAVIIGNLDELRSHDRLDDELDELAEEALNAALRGADLTRRLLAFARQQPLEQHVVDINALVADLNKLLERALGEAVQIKLEFGQNVWATVVDPIQLQSALVNLATNARDAMPQGGVLSIATANRHLDDDYAKRTPEVTAGDYVMIQVTDSGVGIEPHIQKRIFEPFFTTKERGRGTGLGLAMVFGFVKQSGGHINVYSEPGAGTTMRLYLPRAPQKAEISMEPTETSISMAATGETILAVEDNPDLRRVVVLQLERLGYKVIEADSGPAALSILDQHHVDLVFTDMVMPGGLDGPSLIREITNRWPHVKAVMTSGFPEAQVAETIAPFPLLVKPYRREELARLLRNALAS
jgi:PAS domain S-box-containing protein